MGGGGVVTRRSNIEDTIFVQTVWFLWSIIVLFVSKGFTSSFQCTRALSEQCWWEERKVVDKKCADCFGWKIRSVQTVSDGSMKAVSDTSYSLTRS